MHGFGADPLPPVSSYVGYSLEEPWGQPRVVFGIGADEAEKLAAILDGHDCVGPVHAEVTARPDWRQQVTQDWRQQPGGPDAGPGWPLPGTALHVPAQQQQPDAERDGTRFNGPGQAELAEQHDSSIRNGRPDGRADQEPLAELPPFPDDVVFADEQRFADDAPLSAEPAFADEFAAAPVPADTEGDSMTASKPSRKPTARTRPSAKSPGSSQRAARQSDQAAGTGQAKAPARRKTSLTSPLQMPKRVRTRRSADPAPDEIGVAAIAEDSVPATADIDPADAANTGSDATE
jgi:hypothetical protein